MLQFLQLSIQFTDTWIARGSKFTAILKPSQVADPQKAA
jgi:hypothetical protein